MDITRRAALGRLLGLPVISFGTDLLFQRRGEIPGARKAASLDPIRFSNVAKSAGLNFMVENSPTPQKHLIETMAGGVAVFDYNGDGLTDVFFTNGASLPSLRKESPKYWNRLFRNEGGMRLTDVTEEAGVAGEGYSMGAAAADYYNNDGLLDLLVVNYAQWSMNSERFCGDPSRKLRVYCHPMYYEGLTNTLYRNRGDGTFEDVSEKSGLSKYQGRGMSLAFADYDDDGFIDAYVTNDNQPNFLFHNRGDGTFEEVGIAAGVALLNSGSPVSSMGTDFRDYDNDGLPDIFVTDLNNETFPLFHNLGGGMFEDATFPSRLSVLSASRGGWSAGMFDLNNDGWKDLISTNSHADDNVEEFAAEHYRQPNSIFANLGDGTFWDVTTAAGPDFQVPRPHRGCAFADFNNDGKIDVVVSSLQDTAELWQNVSPNSNNWIILKLIGTKSNRDGIGARIRIGKQYNHMTTAVGYASSSHFGVHFGLGRSSRIDEIEIRWPSGIVQVVRNVSPNQRLEVREPK